MGISVSQPGYRIRSFGSFFDTIMKSQKNNWLVMYDRENEVSFCGNNQLRAIFKENMNTIIEWCNTKNWEEVIFTEEEAKLIISNTRTLPTFIEIYDNCQLIARFHGVRKTDNKVIIPYPQIEENKMFGNNIIKKYWIPGGINSLFRLVNSLEGRKQEEYYDYDIKTYGIEVRKEHILIPHEE